MSQLNKEDAEELIATWSQHQVASFRQYELFHRMKVHEVLGFSTLKELIEARLGGYIRLTSTQRLEAVKELEAQGYTRNTDIAQILGVDESTVRADKRKSGNPETSKSDQGNPTSKSGNPERTRTAAQQVQIEKLTATIESMKNQIKRLEGNTIQANREREKTKSQLQQVEEELAEKTREILDLTRTDRDLDALSKGGRIPSPEEIEPKKSIHHEALESLKQVQARRSAVMDYLLRAKGVQEQVPIVLRYSTIEDSDELQWIDEANQILSDAVFEITRVTINKEQNQ